MANKSTILMLPLLIMLLTFMRIGERGNVYAQTMSGELNRCEPYREQVQQILADSGVHPDYYFLMVAESRCTPKAESDKGAQGFWQLMPRTARKYGCNNPHDLVCATKSAANYIKRLQSEFKSFKDVIVAYNMGGHNYIRAKQPTREAIGLVQKVLRLRNDYQRFSSTADETL